ncbi:calcium-binding protein [Nocardioides dubius]
MAAIALSATLTTLPAADAATPRCDGFKATIVGSDGADRIKGTNGRDVIVARGGNDVIDGRGGRDIVCGGAGNDTIRSGKGAGGLLYGDAGRDVIVGEAADLGIYGGAGNDTLSTKHPDTLFEGGGGNDLINGSEHPDVIDGGPGNDRINAGGGKDRLVTGGSGDDTIYGDGGTDVLRGGPGNDTITLGSGVGGFGYGEAGNDTVVAGDDGQALYGGDGNDLMKTALEGTLLDGGKGDDRLYGGAYPDTINGGDGDDTISAAGGDDVALNGGFGTDTCHGGPGRDRCHGGAPGGAANSPDDPDQCTAEVMVSCKGEEFPQRWLATVSGTEVTDQETRNWTLSMVLVRHGDPATTAMWRQESVTGSFAITGADENCTWSHNGELGSNDFTGDFALVTAQDLYWLDVVAGGYGDKVKSCRGGGPSTTSTYFQAWAATEGGPDAIAWDRSKREVTGGWEHDNGYEAVDFEWVITPLA